MKLLTAIATGLIIVLFILGTVFLKNVIPKPEPTKNTPSEIVEPEAQNINLPIFVESLRTRNYPGSEIKIEETLTSGTNYHRYIASYTSDGLKIFGLYTVPFATPPENGWPAIVFVHGYLDPASYTPTARYVAYQDSFARNGFITFKPDLRGHGQSEGEPANASFNEGYIVDTLNLISAFKLTKLINPQAIGIWGHSMGGGIALHDLVVSQDIKAAVIWAGVVGNYEHLLERYRKRSSWLKSQSESSLARSLYDNYGSPSANPKFWNKIDPYAHLSSVTAPVQLHHGTLDDSVPLEFSVHFADALKAAGKTVELYEYPRSDHNLAQDFTLAMQRSVDFFKKYLR